MPEVSGSTTERLKMNTNQKYVPSFENDVLRAEYDLLEEIECLD